MPLVKSFFETEGKGAFSLAQLSLVLMNSQPNMDDLNSEAESEEDRLDLWMNRTAYFHELRHYHDLLGSAAGLHTFLETTELVDRVFDLLRDENRPIVAPILSEDPDSKVARTYRGSRELLEVVLGDMPFQTANREVELDTYPTETFSSAITNLTTTYPMVPWPRRNAVSGVGPLIPFSDHREEGNETNCQPFIDGQLCGTFNGEFCVGQPPDCPFAKTIESFLSELRESLEFRSPDNGADD